MATVVGSAIVFLDSTVVTVALPAIGRELPTPRLGVLEAQSYVYNAYLLTLSSLLVLAGALTDVHGRRRMFNLGLVGFGLTSVLCGLAPTMELLIAGRILQGAAGALLVPGSLSIITATFEGEERGRAFGIWAGASAATTILGPLVGGILVDSLSWRAAFLLNLPLVALAVWASFRYVVESVDPDADREVDWVAALVVALGVGGITFGLIRGQEQRWQDPLAWIWLGLGLVATVVAFVQVRRSRHPLVPPTLFASRTFTVVNVTTLLIYGALYVVLYVMSIHLQGTVGYNATAAGLASIPALFLLAVFSERFGKLAGRYGPRGFLTVGPLLMALGTLWLARIPADSAAWVIRPNVLSSWIPSSGYLVDVLPAMLVFGAGVMVMVAPLTAALMSSVPVRHAGVASAFNNAVSRIGPQLAGAAVFVAVTAAFYAAVAADVPGADSAQLREMLAPLNPPSPEAPADWAEAARHASTSAFHVAMVITAGLLAVGGIVNGLGIERRAELVDSAAGESVAGQLSVPGPEEPQP